MMQRVGGIKMKRFAIIIWAFFPFCGLAEPVNNITVTVQDVPHLSKKVIQSEDFYTNALGSLEKNGVIGYYGFVSTDDAPQKIHLYMFLENNSDVWVNAGFGVKPLNTNKVLGVDDSQKKDVTYLFSPLPPRGKREILTTTYYPLKSAGVQYFKEGNTLTISVEVVKKIPLLQKYLDLKHGKLAKPFQVTYQKNSSLSKDVSNKLMAMLDLTNQAGFSFDALTQAACGNEPQISIQSYEHQKDNIYIYSAVCVNSIGGEGTLDGKEFLALFRLKGGKPVSLFKVNENGSTLNHLPTFFLIGDLKKLLITDLDRNGNVEIVLNPVAGLGSDQFLYEVVDGKLVQLMHENSWNEGEAYSAAESECTVGQPFQDCGDW